MDIKETFKNLKDRWDKLDKNLKIQILIGGFLVVVAILWLIFNFASPQYSVLYSNLSEKDAGQIINKLDDLKIKYKLADNGKTILVSPDKVYKLRLRFATQGLPKGSGVGFEFLDKNLLTDTDFVLNKKYIRALQTELQRTISDIEGIESARVLLVIPKEEVFVREEKSPTASVLLNVKDGYVLSKKTIRAIAYLVSHSVEGLKPQDVVITDSHGNLLSEFLQDSNYTNLDISLENYQLKKKFERDLQRQLQSMLDSTIGLTPSGYRKAIVRVSVDLDFSKKDIQEKKLIPVKDNKGVIISEKNTQETYQGQGNLSKGQPGVNTNIPGYTSGNTTSRNSNYSKTENIVNYDYSTRLLKQSFMPGTEIKRIKVGVILDSSMLPSDVERVKQVIAAVCGIDKTRGDTIQVVSLPFNRKFFKTKSEKSESISLDKIKNFLLVLLAVILVLVVLSNIFKKSSKGSKEEKLITPEGVVIQGKDQLLEAEMPPVVEEALSSSKKEGKEDKEITAEQDSELKKRLDEVLKTKEGKLSDRKELEKFIDERIEDVVRVLRGWLSEGE